MSNKKNNRKEIVKSIWNDLILLEKDDIQYVLDTLNKIFKNKYEEQD